VREKAAIAVWLVLVVGGITGTAAAHYNYIYGDNSNNGSMDGHEHSDQMYGYGGDDHMEGHADADVEYGGNQNDTVKGNNGADGLNSYEDYNGGDHVVGGDDPDSCSVNPGDTRDGCQNVYVY
jgi:Ca2+-binding RTX toxin-like protein